MIESWNEVHVYGILEFRYLVVFQLIFVALQANNVNWLSLTSCICFLSVIDKNIINIIHNYLLIAWAKYFRIDFTKSFVRFAFKLSE